MNSLKVSSCRWMMALRAASVFRCRREAVNELMNWFFRFRHEVIEPGASPLYQSIAAFLRVLGNSRHLMGPLTLW